jgi:hypothetical protein
MGKGKRQAYTAENDLMLGPHSRTWDAGGDLFRDPPEHRNSCSRVIVVIISIVLILGGAAIAILGRVQKDKHIFAICPHCDDLVLAMYILGGCIALIGLVGLIGAITRVRCVAFLFTVLVVIMALALLAAGITVTVYQAGLHRSEIRKLWTDAVHDDPQLICELQDNLDCSGFDMCCNVTWPTVAPMLHHSGLRIQAAPKGLHMVALGEGNSTNTTNMTTATTTTTPAPQTTAAPPVTTVFPVNVCNITLDQYSEQCAPRCTDSNTQYSATCSEKAEQEVKNHMAMILGCLFGGAALLALTAVASVRMTLKS